MSRATSWLDEIHWKDKVKNSSIKKMVRQIQDKGSNDIAQSVQLLK